MQIKILAVACDLQQGLVPADVPLLTAAGRPGVHTARDAQALQEMHRHTAAAGPLHAEGWYAACSVRAQSHQASSPCTFHLTTSLKKAGNCPTCYSLPPCTYAAAAAAAA